MAMAEVTRYVEVLLPLKLRNTLTYRIPEEEMGVGSWVLVPLRGHQVLGVVTRVCDSAPTDVRLSTITSVTAVLDKPGGFRC